MSSSSKITKRNILSEIAKLFDPLGLLGPIIVRAKIIMQRLWQLQLGWDQSLPLELHTTWPNYRRDLQLLNDIKFDRRPIIKDYVDLQINCFSDTSQKVNGPCIYLRSVDERGETWSRLLCSKSRVAPLKSLSLSRLELCAALLSAKLFEAVTHALRRLKFSKIVFWSDSMIVLHWIGTPPHLLKTFASNRVSEIQKLTEPHNWRHIQSEQNPADLIS